jgi:hypothetical protein
MKAVKQAYLPLFFTFAFTQVQHIRQIAQAGEFKRRVGPFKEHEWARANTTGYELLTQ